MVRSNSWVAAACFIAACSAAACAAPPAEGVGGLQSAETYDDAKSLSRELTAHGHVVLRGVPDEATLHDIVAGLPDGGWQVGNSYYAMLDDGRVFYKSWLYLIEITGWETFGSFGRARPVRARIAGSRGRASSAWTFNTGAIPATDVAVVLGTWESEADNALSMKWIPSELPLGAVVLPSKQTFPSNFATGSQPEAYAGIISCNSALRDLANAIGSAYDEVFAFEGLHQCADAREDRDHVLALYRAELGGSAEPRLVVGTSAGSFVAQHLGEKLGNVETHLFGTPRYACKADNGDGCEGGNIVTPHDQYIEVDGEQPYCANGPTLAGFPSTFYRNNPHDRVPGSFNNPNQVLFASNPHHDYSNWAASNEAGANRFVRTDYESCAYSVSLGGRPDCAHFPDSLRPAGSSLACCDRVGCW